ncbi:sigma-70 family RNA polymerase sigma factor [Kribbella ginsengisoli]|uniref:Fis family transcriptional regulator n=1 Tax=Kribbella ginsengisoli TaxID=363865 RepID=A0ABP6Z4E2_9ACTN
MSPARQEQLVKPPAGSAAPLEPDVGLASKWAGDAADIDAAEVDGADRVDRLAADFDLVTGLAFQNFHGLDYLEFEREMAKYGLAVIGSWIRRGLIRHYCLQRGYGGLKEPPRGAFDDADLVEDLAQETVGVALFHFRTVLAAGKWDYRRGASLRTFFIGQCLMRFPNIYRQWLLHDAPNDTTSPDPDPLQQLRRQDPDPEQLVIDQMTGIELLGRMSPRDRRIFQLMAVGTTQTEIAEELGITPKTVERAIANQRGRLRKERGA